MLQGAKLLDELGDALLDGDVGGPVEELAGTTNRASIPIVPPGVDTSDLPGFK